MKNIKKLTLLVFTSTILLGCDLDKFPASGIEQSQSLQSMSDIRTVRLGCYSATRGAYNALLTLAPGIQADFFNSTRGYSNTFGGLNTWTFLDNDYDVTDVWQAFYVAISNINFLLDRIDGVALNSADEENEVKTIKGELSLMRAMVEHEVIKLFCKDYEPETAATNWGIPSLRTYDPNALPGRQTLERSYEMILEDIEIAKTNLETVTGAPDAIYLNINCVYALEAQVYLQMHRYTDSAAAAMRLVNNATYSLINTREGFQSLWSTDNGSEMIYTFFADPNEGRAQIGNWFRSDPTQAGTYYTADYIPAQWILDIYDNPADFRKEVFFFNPTVRINGIDYTDIYLFNKYPGNVSLRTTAAQNNYMHKRKVFRLADMYLIAAEAYAQTGTNDSDASGLLNRLKAARIPGWVDVSYSGSALMSEIKNERVRELVLESNRLCDLKRWGDGLTLRTPQNSDYVTEASVITRPAGDFRFVWPIPQDEYNANPTIKNQRNEGWF